MHLREGRKHVFVARERELGQLDDFLSRALAGQGQVCFVTGEAGSGKTSLVTEFARRAQDQHQALIVAVGQADAETGVGDPYLPFREVLGLLTGDVEAKLSQGAITPENASRLRRILAFSGESLVECGADLIGIFVPGAALALRAGLFVAGKAGWLEKLERLAGRSPESAVPSSGGLEQSHILEQYTNVLRALAEKQPLLLVLDDLQWADSASITLLFHLGRRIGEGRILIVGTYRPEEVALGRAGERHPLQKVLAEFKRYFGDIHIDLDRARETEGRRFVDIFLDTEPNRLSGAFRAAMYRHTGGHPLFTVELLRDMQERGNLVRDERGRWVEDLSLNWGLLPTRVEGVIEERIGRLEEELREVLTVASVEGEDFTAQVVARVREMNERDLVRRLSRELDRQHRLVQEEGVARVREQRLSLYRFRHNLFQSYLYNDLGPTERELLHEDVGNVLEALYGEQVDEIVVQLAWHFERGGVREKARHYLQRAGEQARQRYAYDEAVAYLSRALDLTPETEHAARYELLLARERVYDARGTRDAQRADLADLEGLAEALDDDGRRAEVALRQADYAEAISDFPASIAIAQRVIDLAQQKIGDSQVADGLVAKAHLVWGRALWRQGDFDSARTQLGEALEVARRASLRPVETESLRALGNVSAQQGDYGQARAYYQESLRICREIGDRLGEAGTLNNLGIISIYQGDCAKAESYFEQALRNYREIGDRPGEERAFGNLAHVFVYQGDYTRARTHYQESLRMCREISNRQGEGLTTGNLAAVCSSQGDYANATAYAEQSLRAYREIGDRYGQGVALNRLGVISQCQGDYAAAMAYYEQGLSISRDLGDRRTESWSLSNLGDAHRDQGNWTRATAYYEQGLFISREIGDRRLECQQIADLSLLCHHREDDQAAREFSEQALYIAQEIRDRPMQANALTCVGRALASLGYLDDASDAYAQALDLRRELDQRNLAMEALAGLARVSLARGDLTQAQAHVEKVLSYLESNALDGTDEPFQVYLTCYQVLQGSGDPRAAHILSQAHRLLQEQAVKISDEELRRSFLENVAAHREIMGEFARCD